MIYDYFGDPFAKYALDTKKKKGFQRWAAAAAVCFLVAMIRFNGGLGLPV